MQSIVSNEQSCHFTLEYTAKKMQHEVKWLIFSPKVADICPDVLDFF